MPSTLQCVYCRQQTVEDRFRPFCSERCKMADLGRWLNGSYAVADRAAPTADHVLVDPTDDIVDDESRLR